MKQDPNVWYNEVNNFFIKQLKFKRTTEEFGLYVYDNVNNDKIYCIVCLYVDDMLLACNDINYLITLKQNIKLKWSIKDIGPAKYMLGMNIIRDRKHK